MTERQWIERKTLQWGEEGGWRCASGERRCRGSEAALQNEKKGKGNLKKN